jgi:hypothetical protein
VLLAAPRAALYAATFTGAVGIMLGSAVTLSGVIRPPQDWIAVALALLALASGVVLLVRHAARLPELRSVPGGVIAFLLASFIPALELLSSAAFLPSRTEPALDQRISLNVTELTDEGFRTELDVEATNPTDARILILVTRLDVCWWAADARPAYEDAELVRRPNCTYRRPIAQESWVPAESGLRFSHAFTIPRNRPRVTVIARTAMARGDRVRTSDDVTEHRAMGPCRQVRAVRLEEESRVKSLAQSPKYLVYADFDGDGGLNYQFDTGPDIDCPPKDSSSLEQYFGVTNTRQVRDFWLTPPAQAEAPS